MKPPRLTPAEKAKANPRSGKLAIAAYCFHSCHNAGGKSPTIIKAAIRDCATQTCPLWPLRGWQKITSCKPG